MRIKRPGGLTGFELALVVVLGVAGGIYIWKPLLIKQIEKQPGGRAESPTE